MSDVTRSGLSEGSPDESISSSKAKERSTSPSFAQTSIQQL